MAEQLTKKEKYLLDNFKIDEELVRKISEIGRLSGTDKFNIWIGGQVKKDDTLLNNLDGFLFIIDWAKKEKPNILSLSFLEAYVLAQVWHDDMKFDETIKNKEKEEDDKILYRCRDGIHYFVLLDVEDLATEGETMRNCVGTYTTKVKQGNSLIVSLRDEKNESHVTIEIDTHTGMAIQTKGKANGEPSPKYLKLITEFAIFSSGYSDSMDKELLELMNMKFD